MDRALLGVALGLMLAACGAGKTKVASVQAATDGGVQDAAPPEEVEETGPVEHPFASTSQQATSMMDDAVDKYHAKINKCVDAYRKRKGDPLAKLVVKIGVDQEGTLIGVTGDAKESDKDASDCVRLALKRAPFPKSHAGVIEIKKVFEYQVMTP
jgi:hypothetical protein